MAKATAIPATAIPAPIQGPSVVLAFGRFLSRPDGFAMSTEL